MVGLRILDRKRHQTVVPWVGVLLWQFFHTLSSAVVGGQVRDVYPSTAAGDIPSDGLFHVHAAADVPVAVYHTVQVAAQVVDEVQRNARRVEDLIRHLYHRVDQLADGSAGRARLQHPAECARAHLGVLQPLVQVSLLQQRPRHACDGHSQVLVSRAEPGPALRTLLHQNHCHQGLVEDREHQQMLPFCGDVDSGLCLRRGVQVLARPCPLLRYLPNLGNRASCAVYLAHEAAVLLLVTVHRRVAGEEQIPRCGCNLFHDPHHVCLCRC
mmetsp:Transcript_4042/g.7782  ORF Transcript_4042/g.7782 Transcript_4042/m.7782 type:complete len:269 (+) Transcript_4042:1817-2623(+)